MGIYPPELLVSQETGTSLRELKRMGHEKMMYYYYFICKKKERELEEMKQAQDNAKSGGNSISFKTPAPEGYESWDKWEQSMLERE